MALYSAIWLARAIIQTWPALWHAEAALPYHTHLSYMVVYYSASLSAAIFALMFRKLILKDVGRLAEFTVLCGLLLGGGLLTLLYSFQPLLLAANILANLLLVLLAKSIFRNYLLSGLNFYIVNWLTIAVGLTWGASFILSMPVSHMTKLLLLASAPLLLISLPSDFLQMFEQYDIVARERWKRPRHPFPRRIYSHEPMVSIHVPTYSEPPEMVIETLNVLARLDYTNYEVIVIDNNTPDPALWLPVQAHCKKLGGKFRFIHADNITGAKGGALNHIMPMVDPRASIVGVIDADYHPEPDFLRALVGYFDNSHIGFVQTPHDYRGWKGNLFLTMCYWEYKIFFHSTMISLSERDAGITVGTMCLIRKDALLKAGGWSEWCVTEDSELAIRIHDVGYSSVYVDTTYGRGLIPDTFEGYKKQRYRWTAGPVQEFRHYLTHFLGLSKQPSRYTFVQRLFHLNHGLDNLLLGMDIPLMILGMTIIGSMIMHREIVAVPFELWLTATVMLLSNPFLTLLMFKATIRPRVRDIIYQLIAAKALGHVIRHSAFRTALTGSAKWNRTNKFKSRHSYLAALYATKEEIVLGICIAAFIVVAYWAFPHPGLSLMLLIGLFYMSLSYFISPVVAMISVWSMKRAEQAETGQTVIAAEARKELRTAAELV